MTLKEISGGIYIKHLEPDGEGRPRCLHALQMIFNWRLVRTSGECDHIASGWDRGYCYQGLELDVLANVVIQAIKWNGSDDSEPEGWIKAHRLGPWRPE